MPAWYAPQCIKVGSKISIPVHKLWKKQMSLWYEIFKKMDTGFSRK